MAVCWRSLSSSPFPLLHSHNNNNKVSSIPKPLVSVSETVLFRFPTGISLSKSSFPFPISIPITPNLRFPSLPTISRSSTSDSDSDSDSASASASDARPSLFIKGLPKSTTEGRLMKAFSEFGKVNQVKILTDKMSGQSLGLAYVWFVRQEFAQLAARQMNGKVYICDNIREIIQKTKKEAIQEERPLRIVSLQEGSYMKKYM